ncbi:hypothetical protein ACFQZ4_03890 [Catellatospora coxensis]|uniref:Ig-like domain-containing protein n=1 Tax=Catellatospora coxensis TaxID=310354 RepID=A0A8J3P7J1_9ACTN|nr:hypothetical protein [Catellatospora coxensis]GIG06438.1 hypothetical protein Cco03nite_31380 [Catellatospora coxensis]
MALLVPLVTAVTASPAQAVSLVECESHASWYDCDIQPGYYVSAWYVDGVQVGWPSGPCVPGTRHTVRADWDTGSNSGTARATFTCRA